LKVNGDGRDRIVNVKRRIDKRYKPQTDAHVSKWERLDEYRLGPRKLLKRGQVVKIHGVRGAEFEFQYAEQNTETGDVNLTFVGGHRGHRLTRCFRPDRVGRFVRTSH
jgi:hypothetical protein